ncbi:LLM class flavin-dependent oxidoreductase [Streptomyces sp. NBC_00435]|uniref:LLM class flavin-dependent oxidoreductase n=1 Tax=Streptomyces sp. NBC_00435 TaxID=2903649 RepID=UPI002E2515B4
MPVEFLGIAATNDGSETTARSGAAFDKEYTLRLARAHEDHGWDRVLFAYGAGSPDPAPAAAAYAAGGAEADIYCLWGEPLEETAQQIEAVKAAAQAAGRTDVPRIQVAFRPIIAPTEELAWEKAHRTVGAIKQHRQAGLARRHQGGVLEAPAPQNTGSQRLIAIAAAGDRYDRALWTPTAAATGGAGNSNALVGTPETVAQALLDYHDLGVDILSARGYDLLGDAIDFGRYVIPLVREEVAKRDVVRGAAVVAANGAGSPRQSLAAVRG